MGLVSQEEAAESFAKKAKFWVVLVLSIAGAGFYVANTFAKSADVKAVQDQVEVDRGRVDVLQDRLQQIQDDTHYLRDRLDELLQRK
jgi:hypothetical protein